MVSRIRTTLGGDDPYPAGRKGPSTQELLELLERSRKARLARGAATSVEGAVAGTVTAEPKPQYRPYSVFDAIVEGSKLPGRELTPVASPTALPTPTPQPSPLDYEDVTRGSGIVNKTKELFFDLPKELYDSIPVDPTMPWDWFSFVDRDERTGAPKYFNFDFGRNEDEKASLSRALQLMKGQASGSLDQLQRAAVLPAMLSSAAASEIPGYSKIPKLPIAYSDSANERTKDAIRNIFDAAERNEMGTLSNSAVNNLILDFPETLMKIHGDESLGTQLFQEITSPFGIGELLAGGAPLRRGATSLRNVARATEAVPIAPRLPNIVDQARAVTMRPEHQAWMESGSLLTNPIGKAVHFATRHVNPYGLADADDPVHLINMSVAMRDTTISDAVKGMNSWVLRQGDPK